MLLLGALAAAMVWSLLAEAAAPLVGAANALPGDPLRYAEIVDDILAGGVPYLDVPVEHLPLALVPMLAARGVQMVTRLPPAPAFLAVAIAMLCLLAASTTRLGRAVGGDDTFRRWLALAAPLFPIVVWRVDALPTWLATAAVTAMVTSRDREATALASLGVLAKGWPVVLAPVEVLRGRRRRAAYVTAAGLGAGLFLLVPGFRAGRWPVGLHTETLIGSLTLLARRLAGTEPGVVLSAGAAYVPVGSRLVALQVAGGVVVAAVLLGGLRGRWDPRRAPAIVAGLVLALVLGAPLQSPQFLLWPTPFLAASELRPGSLLPYVAAGAVASATTGLWSPQAAWWAGLVVARNVLLLATTVVLLVHLRQRASTSRRNFPV